MTWPHSFRAAAINVLPIWNIGCFNLFDDRAPRMLLVHPGTQYAPRLAAELQRRGLLQRFWTSIAFAKHGAADRCSRFFPGLIRRAVTSRIVEQLPSEKLRTVPTEELWCFARICFGTDVETALHVRNLRFQEQVPSSEIESADGVIGFDTSSSRLAERCVAKNKPVLLDQSIGHPVAKERIYAKLRARYSDWDTSALIKRPELIDVERREHELARLIISPSEFVKSTLVEEGVCPEKIRINPFGVDIELFCPAADQPVYNKIIFLFAGAISVRKGFPLLIESWRHSALKNSELWIAGSGEIPLSVLPLPTGVVVVGKLSRGEMANLMRKAHAFVFPSFFEGLAQVQLEALASGLPVLGTWESGASEVVADDVDGRILPSGDVDAWVTTLRELASSPETLASMRSAALEKRPMLSWSAYGDRYAAIISELN